MFVITAGRTGPNRSLRFGGDLSLDERGHRDMSALAAAAVDPAGVVVICGPERATRESCALLAADHVVDARLASPDFGAWSGLAPEEIEPEQLRAWFTDPSACPHGGESIASFVERIHRWRADAEPAPDVCVVSMPVAQALLADDAARYFAVEVRPRPSTNSPAGDDTGSPECPFTSAMSPDTVFRKKLKHVLIVGRVRRCSSGPKKT
ncbi:histidine phosphatase family protein [Gordonia sp. SID5947]|uniref:histidine phosphatase family protein n=1 Tax=Gordonia sp. SID5947 TaxID=2690315 RepID=UPI001368D10E|nr:histidine phosphatase family protein [Gordonia sp. SID5947]